MRIFARTGQAAIWSLLAGAVPAAFGGPALAGAVREQMTRSHIPEVGIATFLDGSVEFAYFSSAGAGVSADSVFEAASLSKPVFAVGVLSLVREQRLDLDRPLAAYLNAPYRHDQRPFVGGPVDTVLDPRLGQVTARMVLSHTSGLPNWARGPLRFVGDPGKEWSYSGEGYVYLQRVVEAITGEPLDVFVEQKVLGPLRMAHSSFRWKESFAERALAGHDAAGAGQPIAHYGRPLASSTLYTTLPDYARFISALLAARPGSPFADAELPQVQVRQDLGLFWGLGVAVEQGRPSGVFHWGANPGFQAFFFCQPGTGRGVLFLTDSDNGLDLVDTVMRLAMPGPHPAMRFPMLHPKD